MLRDVWSLRYPQKNSENFYATCKVFNGLEDEDKTKNEYAIKC